MAFSLSVTERTRTGGRSGKSLRRTGDIPAIVYGKDIQPTPVVVNAKLLDKAIKSETGRNTILQLDTDVPGLKGRLVRVKELAIDYYARRLLHADLLEVKEGQPLRVTVPVALEGKAIGLVKDGMIQQIRRELEIECLPSRIPPRLVVDITNLDLGHSIHVADLKMEEGIKAIYAVNFTIVTCVSPTIEKEVVPTPEEAAVAEAAAAAAAAAGTAPAADGKTPPAAEKAEKGGKEEKKGGKDEKKAGKDDKKK